MKPNPVLKKLGFSDDDRLVIIHTDDIGMCQASVAAYADLYDFGLISSAALMVPCPWTPLVGEFCRTHPGVDMGVHITLTSEWGDYRWGPISTRDKESGLLDAAGYFYPSSEEAQANADPSAVEAEIQAQLRLALELGVDVTHIDTHMGAVAHPKFIPAYIQAAVQNSLPAMILRQDAAGYQAIGMDAETAGFAARFVAMLEDQGMPLIDHLVAMPLDQPEGRIDQAKKLLGSLASGVTHFIIHPSVDTPELRAITPDWPSRVADYQAFCSEELRLFVEASGLHVIGYRTLRDLMRS